MSLLTIPQPKSKIPLSPEQKKFKTLSSKVEKLHTSLNDTEKKFEQWLMLYYKEVLPMQQAFASTLISQVKILHSYYKEPKSLSREQKLILKELILEKIQVIFNYSSLMPRDEEILAIFQEFRKADISPIDAEEFEDFKSSTKKMFEDKGIDIDLNDIDITDTFEDIMARVFESLDEEQLDEFRRDREPPPRKKNKREKEQERQLKELQDLQRKGIRTIYKQLARLLHPDLEPDPSLRETKITLMKQLTSAYESNDLFTLLQLERKWGSKSQDQKTMYSDEQLRIFNNLLSNQIESLNMQQFQILAHPRFSPLQNLQMSPHSDGTKVLSRTKIDYDNHISSIKIQIESLQGKNGLKSLKERIKAYSFNGF
ncbi:MAG: hypothetical protein NTX49_06570 [Chlamydiae bacterium]|nr:hypothetical protein [Chlamydiota bacterium]